MNMFLHHTLKVCREFHASATQDYEQWTMCRILHHNSYDYDIVCKEFPPPSDYVNELCTRSCITVCSLVSSVGNALQHNDNDYEQCTYVVCGECNWYYSDNERNWYYSDNDHEQWNMPMILYDINGCNRVPMNNEPCIWIYGPASNWRYVCLFVLVTESFGRGGKKIVQHYQQPPTC